MQIYKCKLNTYIDNNGNLRNKIDYVHLKKISDKKEYEYCYEPNYLRDYLEMINFPKNPKHNQLYKLVPILVDDYYDGYPNGQELKRYDLVEYEGNINE